MLGPLQVKSQSKRISSNGYNCWGWLGLDESYQNIHEPSYQPHLLPSQQLTAPGRFSVWAFERMSSYHSTRGIHFVLQPCSPEEYRNEDVQLVNKNKTGHNTNTHTNQLIAGLAIGLRLKLWLPTMVFKLAVIVVL